MRGGDCKALFGKITFKERYVSFGEGVHCIVYVQIRSYPYQLLSMDNSSFHIPEKKNVDDTDILLPSWWFQPI